MTREGASETARVIAAIIDKPAWIYPLNGRYQVSCTEWGELHHGQRLIVVAVVLPSGQEFTKEV